MFKRLISLPKSHSFFLFGARGTGKTTLLSGLLGETNVYTVNLLEPDTYEKFLLEPALLAAELRALKKGTRVIIDEIQKIPELLNVVHLILEERKSTSPLQFVLTGSSARKLKKAGVNLLAGRAHVFNLFPLTYYEIADSLALDDMLAWGTLPQVCTYIDPLEKSRYLRSYVQTYLKEEIWDEHIIRKLQPFRKFLEVAAQANSQPVNYSAVARDVGVDVTTIQSYYQILEDTLLAFPLESFHESIRKRQSQKIKYYLFDLGVTRALNNALTIPLQAKSYAYGRAFEHFLISEIFRLNSYKELDYKFSYLLTKDNVEIDLIVERPGRKRALIEIKSTTLVRAEDVRALNSIAPDFKNAQAFCFSQDPTPKKFDCVTSLHWLEGLKELGLS